MATGLALAHPHTGGAQLTPEQREQVRAIWQKHRTEGLADARERERDARCELRSLMRAETPDEAAVREAYRRAAKAGEDAAVLRMKARAEVMSLLTPEQREAMKNRSFRRHHAWRRAI
ncbi:MAG TPA: Spy/CpxP family protein refolding chaperone [Candidatus Polarisedimenticolaceae bacterium]|nr:Spy/CpxP family protein refolding chaperone [Candidatus Polarisedimenticolaceae bacterium]